MADEIIQAELEGILAEAQVALRARDRRKLMTALSRAMVKAGDL